MSCMEAQAFRAGRPQAGHALRLPTDICALEVLWDLPKVLLYHRSTLSWISHPTLATASHCFSSARHRAFLRCKEPWACLRIKAHPHTLAESVSEKSGTLHLWFSPNWPDHQHQPYLMTKSLQRSIKQVLNSYFQFRNGNLELPLLS